MKVEILNAAGFCFGVQNIINLALKTKKENISKRVIILGEPVHNKYIVSKLIENGIEIIDLPYLQLVDYISRNVDNNAIYITSAHGHYKDLDEVLTSNKIHFIDGTCPFMKSINTKIANLEQTKDILYFGKKGHTEQIVSCLHFKNKDYILFDVNHPTNVELNENIIITNQSTVKIESFLPYIKLPKNYQIIDNFCPTFKNRLNEVEKNIDNYDVFITISSKNSSNGNEIHNFIQSKNKETYFIQNIDEISEDLLNKLERKKVALVSATSTSIDQVNEIYQYLNNLR